jgi:voltage-gated potassium channel
LAFGVLETLASVSFINEADGAQEALLAGLGADSASQRRWNLDFIRIHYFAFVRLATVGYGDTIFALSPSQMASDALSTSGSLYLANTMGLLISGYTLHAEQQVKERSAAAPVPPPHSGVDSDDQ